MVQVKDGYAEFRFFRPGAAQVHLAGDFNGWRAGDLPMSRDERGYWTAALRLPPGDYRFRYCADGQWFCDFAAFGIDPGPFGPDSVVRIVGRSGAGKFQVRAAS